MPWHALRFLLDLAGDIILNVEEELHGVRLQENEGEVKVKDEGGPICIFMCPWFAIVVWLGIRQRSCWVSNFKPLVKEAVWVDGWTYRGANAYFFSSQAIRPPRTPFRAMLVVGAVGQGWDHMVQRRAMEAQWLRYWTTDWLKVVSLNPSTAKLILLMLMLMNDG